ncbi:MAG: hypothetical protein PHH51_03125 [Bacilli bacterium]|nr:hypothetical protein [Bacilli bacterium]MDD3896002.1 hypothetical protein [Bacilli bacterium]MDD4407932.1 hypothetical protein [Bacilli bacterium]
MDVKKYKKEELYDVAESLNEENIKELIGNLLSTDDKIRYPSFLILQYRSEMKNDVYPYWNNFVNMLDSNNSYFRTIGLKLIALNIKWDKGINTKNIIDKYLFFCNDEKISTARLCIQGISNILKGTNFDQKICEKVVMKLTKINIKARPSTNIKVMTTDVVNILIEIEREIHFKEIVIYLNKCLEESIVDKNIKQEIEELLN